MSSYTYTHKGWFLMCPVYIAGFETGAATLDERHWLLTPWMKLNEYLCQALIFIRSVTEPDYVPMFPILVTGELKTPKTVTYQ